eukprot:gene6710-4807_t
MLKLRVRAPKMAQPQEVEFAPDTPWAATRIHLSSLCGIDEDRIRVLQGFPPKPIEAEDSTLLQDMKLRPNEMLTVQDGEPRVQIVNTGERYVQLSHDRAHFRRRNCPADNSCLFHSCAYILKNRSRIDGPTLRQECISWILTDPKRFQETTGEDATKYCQWLAKPDSWGGYVELGILSELYKTEIVVLDIQSGSIIRCGEEHNYPLRGFVVFTGTHYDAIAMSTSSSLTDESQDQVLFNPRDEKVFQKADEFIKEEQRKK